MPQLWKRIRGEKSWDSRKIISKLFLLEIKKIQNVFTVNLYSGRIPKYRF